jgi:uncharacterized membrane protein
MSPFLRSLQLRLKLFFLKLIKLLLIKLHEVGVNRQILESYNHLRLLAKVDLLLLVGKVHTRHVVEVIDVMRVTIVRIVLNVTVEARKTKALILER